MKKRIKNNKWLVGGLVAVAFFVGGLFFVGTQVDAQMTSFLPDRILDLFDRHVELERADAIEETETPEPVLGAASGPSIDFPSWEVNGVKRHYLNQSLKNATTTPCDITTPSATTSLISFGVNLIKGPTTTATTWTFGTSTLPNATTTALFGIDDSFTVSANTATGTSILWLEPADALTGLTYRVLPPNTHIVAGMKGVSGDDMGNTQLTSQASTTGIVVTKGNCEAVLYQM